MKKILLIILCVVAIPLYGYNAYLLLRTALPFFNHTVFVAAKPEASFEMMLRATAPVRFIVKGRDPFTLYKEKSVPVITEHPVIRKAQVKNEILPPPISISGILWNSANPVAMIKLPGGKTALAKAGLQLGENLTIKRVEKKSIVVLFEGKEFTIEKK